MKKIGKICTFVLLLIFCTSMFSACSLFTPKTKTVNCETTILTKNEAIQEIKYLLKISDIYFYDCDFTNMPEITITDTSYNLSVTGSLIYDDETHKYYIDINKQASIKLVSNYRIVTNSMCFGFSMISNVMKGKTDSYVNGEYDSTSPTIIYTSETYKNVAELYNNGQTTGSISGLGDIKVPKNFYTCDIIKNGFSVQSTYLKTQGDVNSWTNFKVVDQPIHLLTHYASYSDKSAEGEQSTIVKLINYFNLHGYYSRH